MSTLLTYKDFKAQLRFDHTKDSFIVKIIGVPSIFYATSQGHAEEEFHRVVDKELINQVSEHEKKLLNKSYSGNIAIRTFPELHQELTLAADRKGLSLNSYIEKKLQAVINQEALGNISEEVKSDVPVSIPLAVKRLIEEDKAVELFRKIGPCLDDEKINIFQFHSILRRFLINFGSSIEEISPYLKAGKIYEFVMAILSLIKESGETRSGIDDEASQTHLYEA
jgi:predicted HicB family RNase H-like nuclease